jgi:hypothetical protein
MRGSFAFSAMTAFRVVRPLRRAPTMAAVLVGMLLAGLLATAHAASPAAAADADGPPPGRQDAPTGSAPGVGPSTKAPTNQARFSAETASRDTRRVADWVVASGDNHGLPFVIIDKVNAKVFVFDPPGRLQGAARALLGLARGDDSIPGIGSRKLSGIRPEERTTPAGRFVASLGNDLGEKDVLWVDYDAAISLHRVIRGDPGDHRLLRLGTKSSLDKRISYGCINVPVRFYERIVRPIFMKTTGIVYILPEMKRLHDVFPGV